VGSLRRARFATLTELVWLHELETFGEARALIAAHVDNWAWPDEGTYFLSHLMLSRTSPLARLAGDPYIVERMGKSMSRVLQIGDSGADVALLQRDLNVWYGYWGAPARVMLDRDGDLGPSTELAFRRVRARLGLELVEKAGRVQITPRDRVLVRHLGRLLVAKRAGHTHEIPASIKRTPEEIARGKEARAYETRLRARFREMR
jgi:hypothetical protein